MPIASIKQFVIWSAPEELDATGEKMDIVKHLCFLMREIVYTNLSANGLNIREITEEGKALYLIMTDGQFTNFYIHIRRLREESNIRLIVTMILEEIDLLICHLHFTVIEVYAGLINDNETVLHEEFTYIILGDLESTTNRKIAIHSAASSKSFFCQFCSVSRLTGTRQAKIKINTGIIGLDRTIDEAPKMLVAQPFKSISNIHRNLQRTKNHGGACAPPRDFFSHTLTEQARQQTNGDTYQRHSDHTENQQVRADNGIGEAGDGNGSITGADGAAGDHGHDAGEKRGDLRNESRHNEKLLSM